MEYLVILLAAIWGGIWAAFIQFVPLGRFLAQKRTWITVVVGVGVDLAIAKLIIPWEYWKWMGLIIGASSLAIILRSLINEWGEWRELFDVFKNEIGE
jgi:hypothetical protein